MKKDDKILVLCYKKCTTCQKALKWLDDHQIVYVVREIKENNPSSDEIEKWHKESGLPLKRFFNSSGNLYKELQLKDKLSSMTQDEQYKLLAKDGMLVKRPLLVTNGLILTGFKESEWKANLTL